MDFALDRAGELRVATEARATHIRPYSNDGARALRALLAGIRRVRAAGEQRKRAPAPTQLKIGREESPFSRHHDVTLVKEKLDSVSAVLANASAHVADIETDLTELQVPILTDALFCCILSSHSTPLPRYLHGMLGCRPT